MIMSRAVNILLFLSGSTIIFHKTVALAIKNIKWSTGLKSALLMEIILQQNIQQQKMISPFDNNL